MIINDYKPNEERIIETSHNYYSLEKGVRKYKEVYQSILEGKITHDDTSPLLK